MPVSNLKLLTGRANPVLAQGIADYIGVPIVDTFITDFADNEIFVKIRENVRGKDVYIIQPTCNPGHKNLMELLIMIDALRRASAERITAVIPYFGYARQDRKAEPRVPISAKLVANLVTVAGTDRLLTLDLHAAQIQGFFDIPVDHLHATPVFLKKVQSLGDLSDFVVVSPDIGGVERSRFLAKLLNTNLAILDKRREKKNEAEVLNLIGEVEGLNVVMIDDMVDTAGTICQSAAILKKKGAKAIHVFSSHAVLSGPAAERLKDSMIDKIYFTDSIPIDDAKLALIGKKMEILTVAGLIGEAIERIHLNESVNSLFVNETKVQ
ncbi:MAG: phosphoribosylpyrophosphate synthetase [Spirochaetes bacterium GWF1_51_8]|nr:MAG: phosphoribosylpyrophosphate synthetase [Spirochaetes bacterium GWF1_51_8]